MSKLVKLILIVLSLAIVAEAAPVITNLGVTATTTTTATISWTTNTSASSQILYGVGNIVNNTPVDGTLVTSHSVTISGLRSGTLYSYAAVSDDGAPTQSSTQTFQLCTGTGTTSVSGTINNFYEYGPYTINWTNQSGQAVSPTICGVALTQSFTGNLDGSGSFAGIALADAQQIVPSPSTWSFGFKAFGGTIGSISSNIPVTGASQDISTTISAAAVGNLQHVFYDPATTSFYPAISGTGTVTSVGLAGPTGIVVTNSPVTSGGTLTWAMPAGWTTGDVLVGNGANSVARLAKGGNGSFLGVSGGVLGYFTPATGASTFDQIGSGTNSTASMLCGTGCALGPSGSGTVTANAFNGILPGANGGTGNGFFAIAGPATSLKTFTFPNASSTVLTTNSAVTVPQGGTGATTFTTHGTLIGEGTGAIVATATGTSGQPLVSNGSVADPTYQTLPIAGGGTNAITAAAAAINLLPTPTRAGDVLYWNGTAWTTLAGNNSGTQVLQENASGAPSWGAGGGGGGNVTGPGSSTTGNLATWGNTSGTLLSDSGVALSSLTTSGVTLTTGQLLIGAGLKAINVGNLSGDVTTSGSTVTTVVKVNNVAYGSGPSTNTVPVVTGSNTVTYETVPIAAGGTGAVTQTAAFNGLAPTPTRAGDVIYYNGINWVQLAGNNSGTQFLQESSSGVPSWATTTSTPCTTTALSLQFNNAGAFGCTATLTWNATNGVPALAVGAVTSDVNPLAITWTNNNAGVDFGGIKWTLTDTASGANTKVFQIIGGSAGTTSLLALDKAGNQTIGGSLTVGPTGGVGGTVTIPEGTAASASASNDVCYADSTIHGILCSYNNAAFKSLPLLTGTMTSGDLVSVNSTTNLLQDAGIGVTSVVTASGTLTSGLVALGAGSKALTVSANLAFSGATLTVGSSGSASGNIAIPGSSTGTVTIAPQAAAGTYNFNLPITAGSTGQPLLSGGGGATAMSFGTLGVGGGGTGITSGTSGGVLGYTAAGTLASSAALTANAIVLGGGAGATPLTVAGLTTDGASKLVLGVASTSVGSIDFHNASTGTINVAPTTGALGTSNLVLPARSGTIATTTGTLTSGNGTAFDSSGNVIDGGFVAANVNTASANAGAAGQIPYSAGANKALSYDNLTFAAQTDGATVTWAIGSVPLANATLTFTTHGGSRTLNLTGLLNGGSYVLWLKQDATGGEGLTLGTGCTWKVSGGGAGAITPSTGANAIDILAFTYDGTNCYANFNKSFS